MSRMFLLSKSSRYYELGVYAQYKTQIIGYQMYCCYSVKNIFEVFDFNPFFCTKEIIWEWTNYSSSIIAIPNILSHFVSTDIQEADLKKQYLNFYHAHCK